MKKISMLALAAVACWPAVAGVQPLVGELRQAWLLSGAYAWDTVDGMMGGSRPSK